LIDNQKLNTSHQSHIVSKKVNIVLGCVNRNIFYETHGIILPFNFLKFFVLDKIFLK